MPEKVTIEEKLIELAIEKAKEVKVLQAANDDRLLIDEPVEGETVKVGKPTTKKDKDRSKELSTEYPAKQKVKVIKAELPSKTSEDAALKNIKLLRKIADEVEQLFETHIPDVQFHGINPKTWGALLTETVNFEQNVKKIVKKFNGDTVPKTFLQSENVKPTRQREPHETKFGDDH